METAIELADQRRKKEAMEALVDEISHSEDENVAVSIRSALERGWNFKFAESLAEARIKKENEIDRICAKNYNDFLASIQEVIELRGEANLLSSEVNHALEEFESTGAGLLQVLNSLEDLQKEKENFNTLSDTIIHCKEVVFSMKQVKDRIKNDDIYGALRSIQLLSKEQSHVTFKPLLHSLKLFIPQQTDLLLMAAKIELTDLFTDLRLQRISLGRVALSRCAIRAMSFDHQIISKGRPDELMSLSMIAFCRGLNIFTFSEWVIVPNVLNKAVPDIFSKEISEDDEDFLENLPEQLAPLLKVSHVHSQLGLLPDLRNLYRTLREPMMSLRTLHTSPEIDVVIRNRGLEVVMPDVTAHIAGFFVWECISRRLLDHPEGVLSVNELNALWDRACGEVLELCIENAAPEMDSPDGLLLIKEELLLLAETLSDEAFGLRPLVLQDITAGLWTRFMAALATHAETFIGATVNDRALKQPTLRADRSLDNEIKALHLDQIRLEEVLTFNVLSNAQQASVAVLEALEEELDEDLGLSKELDNHQKISAPLAPSSSPDATLMQWYTFSDVVVKLLVEVRLILARLFLFATSNLKLGDKGEQVCAFVSKVFEYTVIAYGKTTHRESGSSLDALCQACADAAVIARTIEPLGRAISGAMTALGWTDSAHKFLQPALRSSRKMLEKCSDSARDAVFEYLSERLDEHLLALKTIAWDAVGSSHGNTDRVFPKNPHVQVAAMIQALQEWMLIPSMKVLPLSVTEACYFTCCVRMSRGIVDHLLSSKVPKISTFALDTLTLDLRALDEFTEGSGVVQLNQCFLELRELVTVLLLPDLVSICDGPQPRFKQHPLCDPIKLATLVDKLTVTSASTSFFGSLMHSDKKALHVLSKKLRQMREY